MHSSINAVVPTVPAISACTAWVMLVPCCLTLREMARSGTAGHAEVVARTRRNSRDIKLKDIQLGSDIIRLTRKTLAFCDHDDCM